MPRIFLRHIENIFQNRIFNSSFPPEKAVLICILFAFRLAHCLQDCHAVCLALRHAAVRHHHKVAGKLHVLFRKVCHPMHKGVEKCSALAHSRSPLNQRSFRLQCVSSCFRISRISAGSRSSEFRYTAVLKSPTQSGLGNASQK